MPGYFIASYDVSDADQYAQYNPGNLPAIMQTIAKHEGRVLIAGPGAEWFDGKRKSMVVIEFPTFEAAKAWRSDPDYAEFLDIRIASTTNRVEVIAPHFEPPTL